MVTKPFVPKRDRPDIPKEYGVPATEKGLVEWAWVVDELVKAKNYWLISQYPDGRTHCVPSWGAWVDDKLYFSGGPMTRHAKNLAVTPGMIAHLESGDKVVIIYGKAINASDTPPDTMAQINKAYEEKYGAGEGATYALVPDKILTWTEFPTTPTRFTFG